MDVPENKLPDYLRDVPEDKLPVDLRPSVPQESFLQEFKRTRQQEMEAASAFADPRRAVSIFQDPKRALMQAVGGLNYPFALTGISPLIDVVSRRYVEKPVEAGASYVLPKSAAEVLGKTAGLGAQMFLPGPMIEGGLSYLAPTKTVSRLAEGERLAGEATKAQEAASAIRETQVPKVESATEALESELKKRQRLVKAGEAAIEEFPSRISSKKMTPFEAGAEYGGTTTQAKPRLEELGVYGQLAKASSEHFKGLYDAVRSDVKDIRVPVESLNEIKMGVFEGLSRSTAQYQPIEYQTVFDIMNQKSTPRQVEAAQRAMEAAEKAGKPFGPADLAAAASEAAGKTINGSQLLDRVHILRNQARTSSNDLVEFLRQDLANKYMDLLGEATTQAGKPEVMEELNRINGEYRQTREYFGKGAIPRELAGQQASDIIQSMFGPGKGRVERARIMRQVLPKEQFDAYVRTFHETVFNPEKLNETLNEWDKLTPEMKSEMYGSELSKTMDNVVKGLKKDQKSIGQLDEALANVGKYGTKLTKKADLMDKSAKEMGALAQKYGYVIDPDSTLGQIVHNPIARGGYHMAIYGSTMWGMMHGVRGLLDLGRNMPQFALYQFAMMLTYMAPNLLPRATATVQGAKTISDLLNATSNQQKIQAAMAFRALLSQMGTNFQTELDRVGLKNAQ